MTQLNKDKMQDKFKEQFEKEITIVKLNKDEEVINEVNYKYRFSDNSDENINPPNIKIDDIWFKTQELYFFNKTWLQKVDKIEKEDEMTNKFTSFDKVESGIKTSKRFKPTEKKNKKPVNNNIKLVYRDKTVEIDKNGSKLGDFWFEPNQIQMASYMLNVMNEGGIDNVLALGESGVGKTQYIKNLGKEFNIPVYYLNCAIFRDPTEWFGKERLQNNETFFELSDLSRAIQNGNCIIIMDELNRTDEFTRGVLLSLFDDTKAIKIHNTEIKVGDGTIFYATANIGNGYTGTHTFDIAEFRRFVYIRFEKLTSEREQQILVLNGATNDVAHHIVIKMNQLRDKLEKTIDYEIPFRLTVAKSLQVLKLHKHGLDLKNAFLFAIIEGIPQEAKEAITTIINGNYA